MTNDMTEGPTMADRISELGTDYGKAPTWKLGQYVRVWRGGSVGEHDAGGYEYGHIEWMEDNLLRVWAEKIYPYGLILTDEVMLTGDDGKEIYARVKDLEAG